MLGATFNDEAEPREYAFFKAGGRTFDAIERTKRASEHYRNILNDLSWAFGSHGISFNHDPGKLRFVFRDPHNKPPAGWSLVEGSDIAHINPHSVHYPSLNSDDFKTVKRFEALLAQVSLACTVEHHLDQIITEREFPAFTSHATSFAVERYDKKAGSQGGVHPALTAMGRDARLVSVHVGVNPCLYNELCGDYYLRVPCDKTGKPVFIPPDSVEVTIADVRTAMHNHKCEEDSRKHRNQGYLI